MSAVPQAITVNGATYTVPGADTIEPLAASVSYDGSGASGDFMPCLSIYSQDGHLISRTFPQASVAAGASAEVSFIPFVPPASGAAAGGGIQFDTEPQSGDWLYVETTGAGPAVAGQPYGFAFQATPGDGNSGMLLKVTESGAGTTDAMDLYVTTEDGQHIGLFVVSEATGDGDPRGILVLCDADGDGRARGIESDATATGSGIAKAVIASAEADGGGVATGLDATAATTAGGNAIAGAFGADTSGGGTAYALKVSKGLCDLKLPTSPGVAGTLWNNGGVVTVS